MLEDYRIAMALYWLAVFAVAVVVLVRVTAFCTGDHPGTWGRAIRILLLTGGIAFFAYDLTGYLFVILMQDPTAGIRLPAHYSYWDWLREPLVLKWRVLGFVPVVRFLPIGIAIVLASVAQIFLWQVTFPMGLLIVLLQLFLDLSAMVLLSIAVNFGLRWYEQSAEPPAKPVAERYPEADPRAEEPTHLAHLRQRIDELPGEAGPFWRRARAGWQTINVKLEPLYTALEPVTKHLPLPARGFLNAGGWLLVPPGLIGLCIWIRRGRAHHRQRKTNRTW